ncbi:hypothetical protein MTO96_051477 [Rhipicephalus appendiculatus]
MIHRSHAKVHDASNKATNAPPSAAACGDAGLSFVDADVESQSNCDEAGSLDAFTALLVVATLSALLEPSPVVVSDSELEVSGFPSRERCPLVEPLSTLSRGRASNYACKSSDYITRECSDWHLKTLG